MPTFWSLKRAPGGGFDAVVFGNEARTNWLGSWLPSRTAALAWIDGHVRARGGESFAVVEPEAAPRMLDEQIAELVVGAFAEGA